VSCKITRDGNLLIQTKDGQQAEKLLKLTSIQNNIPESVSKHRTLNYSKGVIYSNDLFIYLFHFANGIPLLAT